MSLMPSGRWMTRTFMILTIGVLATSASLAAQTDGPHEALGPVHVESRELTPDLLRERIHHDASLSEQDRTHMLENLQACLEMGSTAEDLEAIFPSRDLGKPINHETMLRMQVRVRDMLREGMHAGLVLEKVHEGRVKGVPSDRIEHVATQMEHHVQTAHRFLERGRAEGIHSPTDRHQRRVLERHLALDLWSGLGETDLDHLHEKGLQRDGSCSASDLVAAANVASVMHQRGIDKHRSVELAGDALEAGFTTRDMRMLGAMMSASHLGEHGENVLHHLHQGMNDHRQLSEMAREMMSWGWMGPADASHGGDWHNMMDDWMGGGPGDHRDGDHDHMGGDDGHGGMGDGHDEGGHGGDGGMGG